MDDIAKRLIEYMKTLPVIDAHSHLADESELFANAKPDIFTRIFTHYSLTEAETSGLVSRAEMRDTSRPIEERWTKFKPCLKITEQTGTVQAALLTAKEYYGFDMIDDTNYIDLQQKIIADSASGQTTRVIDFCKIERMLNQHTYNEKPVCAAVTRDMMGIGHADWVMNHLRHVHNRLNEKGYTYDGARGLIRAWLDEQAAVWGGISGVKLTSDTAYAPLADSAESDFKACLGEAFNNMNARQASAVANLLMHEMMEEAGERNIPVAVHCGINWCCTDHPDYTFYNNNPQNIMPWAAAHKNTTFDLYHAGIPWVREIAVIANQLPNVVLNLVWVYQLAPRMTANFLDEWMDLVPLNKIIGFGGDSTTPEKTVGALSLARRSIAEALSSRVRNGLMSESRASDVCRLWLYENPKRIYRL